MLDEGGFATYQDPALQPPDAPQPWEGATCGECLHCSPVEGSDGHCCVLDVIDQPSGLGVLVRVGLGDKACESIERR